MTDPTAARRMMVDGQIRTADITDPRLLGAMQEVPRERFVPEHCASIAYLDRDVPLREGRHLLKPMVLARLVHAAEVSDTDRVLDVGCGSGYSSAVLARLAASVVALEEDTTLAARAKSALAGAANVSVVQGPLARGFAAEGPYDAIVLQGAAEVVPPELTDQLKEGGRLVCVLGRGLSGKGMIYRRIGGDVSGRPLYDAAAPMLPGFAKPPAFVF